MNGDNDNIDLESQYNPSLSNIPIWGVLVSHIN